MTNQLILQKLKRIEKELRVLRQPKAIVPKMIVDEGILRQATGAIFDFDIEKFVTAKDLRAWKS
ncbi:MAG TPA: hypothetical protein VKS81_00205 [Bacteroidota bacterium]|nr:hypothetical protein [Bacteroidota bacterium]